jgi:hypothetical protein
MLRTLMMIAVASAVLGCRAAPPQERARIVLERSVCFGFCPAYRVSLATDGVVRFEGLDSAAVRDSGTISADTVRALARRFEEAGFFGMDSAYVPGEPGCGIHATDNPYATLTLDVGGRQKIVRHYYGCMGVARGDGSGGIHPPTGAVAALASLATQVDSAAGTARWLQRAPRGR